MDISAGNLLFLFILAANFFFVLFIICIERKNSALALSWILTLIFLPVVGFVLYLLFGTNVMIRKKKVLDNKRERDLRYGDRVIARIHGRGNTAARPAQEDDHFTYRQLLALNDRLGGGTLTTNNEIDIFVSAKDKYRQLIRDIERAKTSIHLLYFIIRNDRIGRMIIDILARKARAGVRVRLLYDHAGCLWTPNRTFRPLVESGAQVERFFPIHLGNYLRINFRNHRKIAIIDGAIGYLGGMNIGDEYMGLAAENLPWRDTHLRITGGSVHLLQLRFLEDWRFAAKYEKDETLSDFDTLFPPTQGAGNIHVQIVSSGPDTEEEDIKWNFLKLIYTAKKRICIQTPYFVPDDSFLEALKIAALAGVEISIMAPSKTDNFIAQKVSMSYLGELLPYGIKVYLYPGFLHAKMLIFDDQAASIGSANIDMRSFSLNFEINSFVYGKEFAKRCLDIFADDLLLSAPMNLAAYQSRGVFDRLQEGAYRLIAPLL